jgi:hypothetical protein
MPLPNAAEQYAREMQRYAAKQRDAARMMFNPLLNAPMQQGIEHHEALLLLEDEE